jgi:cell division protein ZapA (FtsZ GTPase activity inhibitor)
MQTKGSKYTIFCTHQIPPNLHFATPLAKQNQSMKCKFDVVGETIAFSICYLLNPSDSLEDE